MVSTSLPVLITAKIVYHKANYLSSPALGRAERKPMKYFIRALEILGILAAVFFFGYLLFLLVYIV